MTRAILLFFIFILLSGKSSGQVTFDDNFENGRIDTAILDSTAYRLWPITNLHFRITDAINEKPSFKIFDSLGYQLRPYHYMVYRYENDTTWNHFDTAYKATSVDDYYFNNHSAFTNDTVYISYWFPYTYSQLQNYLSSIQGSSYLTEFGIKTHTIQNRNIYGYEITDPAIDNCYKKNVVITARQHPIEFINGYFIEGITNYLLYSTDSLADVIRSNFRFFIYPMLNPDGVVNGIGTNVFGQDLNRSWEDSLLISNIPESDSIRPVIWHDTNQRIDFSIDIHANPGNNQPYYWWGYTGSSPVPQWQQAEALNYVQAVHAADTSGPMSQSLYHNYIQGNGVGTAKTAANWFRKSFNAIAFTFEPTTEPLGPLQDNRLRIEDLKGAGSSLAIGFADLADTLQTLNGQLIMGTNYLIATVNGGTPPYTYQWSGPVNGIADTLFNAVSGTYIIQVNDSLGCTWTDTLVYAPTHNHQQDPNKEVRVYPNPVFNVCHVQLNDKARDIKLSVYDLIGSLKINESVSNTQHIDLNVAELNMGTYLLKIQTEDMMIHKKLIVH
ncbi:MAG: T9SS type A sorting domain-containing protein [Bacteroidia bacterium]|nr:T9SS type A sorting domain-containing protein [Bacteroidia bacterium]